MSRPFAPYDRRQYPTLDVPAGYGAWASTYDQTVDEAFDLRLLAQLESVRWASHGRALDLACGTGRLGRWLGARGVRWVDGLDLTPAMLGRATGGAYAGLALADITRCPAADNAYDLAMCGLAACHLPGLEALYREAARVVRPGGHFILLDYHPFFLLNGIPTHFTGPGLTAGWMLREMRERLVDVAWAARVPAMARHLGQPISFALAWQLA
jgi:SAM-dependent methyltransferase